MTKSFNDNSDVTSISKQIETLKKHFPQCFDKHGAFMPDKLQALINDNGTEFSKESYSLNWLGKSYARLLANEKPLTFLSEDKTHNQKPENQNSEHLLIKGDNLEVLKHLKNAYAEQVKMIYIDPPYNTGTDGFVYQDDRKFTVDELSRLAGIDSDEAKRILDFTQSQANSHSAWLTFMYPRLYVARDLLRDDGVIFISIDDNEQAQLKVLCDEVFGEENFVNILSVNMKNIAGASGGGEDKRLKKNIEYLYVYALNYEKLIPFNSSYVYTPVADLVQQYREDNISWKYTSVLMDMGGKEYIGSTVDGDGNEIKIFLRKTPIIKSINRIIKDESLTEEEAYKKYADKIFQTAMPQSSIRPRVMEKINDLGVDGDLFSIEYVPKTGKNKGVVYEQFYKGKSFRLFAWLSDVSIEIDGILYKRDLQGTYWDFVGETKNLTKEGDVPFPNGKKPLALIDRMLKMQTDPDSIILDFFAGSGTTAHAVMQLNAKEGGNRQFICVQIDELTDPKSEAYKADYKTIFDITKARIEKAAEKIKTDNPDYQGDLGFKIFETIPVPQGYLDEYETINPTAPLFNGSMLSNEQLDDLLTTWKVYDGIPLTTSLTAIDLAGYMAYQHQKMLYLIHDGFSNAALVTLLQKIDDTDKDKAFDVERLVLFAHNFDSKHQREIKEAVTHYQNKKAKNISVEFRY